MNVLGWQYWQTNRPCMIRSRTSLGTLLISCNGKIMTMGCKTKLAATRLVKKLVEVANSIDSQLSYTQPIKCLSSTYISSIIGWRMQTFTRIIQYISQNSYLPHCYSGEVFPSVITLRLKANCGKCINLANSGKCTFLGIKSLNELSALLIMLENLLAATASL